MEPQIITDNLFSEYCYRSEQEIGDKRTDNGQRSECHLRLNMILV